MTRSHAFKDYDGDWGSEFDEPYDITKLPIRAAIRHAEGYWPELADVTYEEFRDELMITCNEEFLKDNDGSYYDHTARTLIDTTALSCILRHNNQSLRMIDYLRLFVILSRSINYMPAYNHIGLYAAITKRGQDLSSLSMLLPLGVKLAGNWLITDTSIPYEERSCEGPFMHGSMKAAIAILRYRRAMLVRGVSYKPRMQLYFSEAPGWHKNAALHQQLYPGLKTNTV